MTHRFARTAGWLALPCLIAAGLLAWYVTREPASPFTDAQADTAAAALVSRGEYVARLSDCVACHSLPEGQPFAGGLQMATPLGPFMPPTSPPIATLASAPTAWRTSTAPCATAWHPVAGACTRPCPTPRTPNSAMTT